MRICFVNTGNIQSIATMKRSTGFAKPLMEMGNEVAIVALDCEINRARFNSECPNIDPLYYYTASRIKEVKQKIKLINEWKPDVVYVSSIGFRNFITKFNVNAKVVIVEHCELLSAIESQRFRFVYKLFENSCQYLYDGMIVASRYLEDYYVNKGFTIPMLYSQWGYNPETLGKIDYDYLQKLKNQYTNKKVILYMGWLVMFYGFMEILEASLLLKSKHDNYKILILGDGCDKSIGEKFVKENHLEDTIEFLGYVSEETLLPTYLALADVFVSPLNDTVQDWARCPGKLFMYTNFKKPVVTCAIGEAKELFGDSGLYYNHNNIESFAHAIEKALIFPQGDLVDPSMHTWRERAKVFVDWLQVNFKIN